LIDMECRLHQNGATPSLGVLIKAKETGVIKSVKEILNLIDKTNFRISNSIKEQVLKKAGEL